MKIASLRTTAGRQLAAERNGEWLPLKATSLVDVLRAGDDREALRVDPDGTAISDPSFAAPLTPGKIVAIGLNYMDHVRESGVEPPERPLVFAKFPSVMIGAGDSIQLRPGVAERVDWEAELGVVIGRRLSDASEAQALDAIFGYTIANDVSARDVQFSDGQWIRGKNLDTFCPVGPAVVTRDEIADPQALAIRTTVNGETVQDGSTAEMIFGVAQILSFCSHSFTLEPGDLVLTGTPWGCGEFMTPQRSLQAGDVVEVSIEGLGTLRNDVVLHAPS